MAVGVNRKLFLRDSSLIVGDLDISALDFDFKSVKSLKPEPNTLDLKVYNLSVDTRRKLQKAGPVTAVLNLGYLSGMSQAFLGQIRSTFTDRDGPDLVTHIASGDSEQEIQKSRCAVTFGSQVSVDAALNSIVKTLGLGNGNLAQAVARLKQRGITNLFPRGGVFYGNTWRVLQDFARSAQLEISIQDGHLQILDIGQALQGKAILLASGDGPKYPGQRTGIIGSPTIDADGTVNAVTLPIPEINPGRVVIFDTLAVQGQYRIYHCEYNGEKRGKSWYINLVAQPLQNSQGFSTGK